MSELKLNLGCGQEHEKGYINIDIQEPCDLKHDLRTSLPFADNSVDEIYAKDFIRVLSRSERQRLNKEISRVLKPGGKLQIIYLDFESAARAFLDSKLIKDRGRWLKFIFGGQRNEYHFCKDGLTRRKLITCLFRNGLSGFKIKQFLKDDPDYEGYFSLTCYKKLPTLFSHKSKLKILAGTPIHINYPAEKWLERISRLKYPVDLLMVDSSPTLDYVEKVKGYCAKYGIKNYKIKHLEIGQFQPWAEKVGRSREIIRREILAGDYDVWLSLECDQLLPINHLERLLDLRNEDFDMIFLPFFATKHLDSPDTNFGCALIKRKYLEKFGFLLEYYPGANSWNGVEVRFKDEVLKSGGNYIVI